MDITACHPAKLGINQMLPGNHFFSFQLNVKKRFKFLLFHKKIYFSNMGFKEQQAAIQRELDRFIDLLGVLLPRYSKLLKRKNLTEEELHELGELEHFLIGVNGRISEIKQVLEQDVYGHSLDLYYKLKAKANLGDEHAAKKLSRLRDSFNDSMISGQIIHWN